MVTFKCPFGSSVVDSKQSEPEPVSAEESASPTDGESCEQESETTSSCGPADESVRVGPDGQIRVVADEALTGVV